jgi:peptidyl-tRNA hydrolase, PTH2 family
MEHKVRINETNDSPLYMYILVNDDLKMGKGKIAGQVGHVVGLITEEIIRKSYESSKGIPDCYSRYMVWKMSGYAKVVLKATQEQIEQLVGEPESMYIRDAGRTQISPNSLTVLGFYPSSSLKVKFKDFKLL